MIVKCKDCKEKIDTDLDNFFKCSACGDFYCEDCSVEGEMILTCSNCGKEFCYKFFGKHKCVKEVF